MKTDPPQPPGGEYPLSALKPSYITDYVNQAGYLAATGKPAPAYNAALPSKTWVDTRKGVSPITIESYLTIGLDATNQIPAEPWIQMSDATAVSVNIKPDSGPIDPSTAGSYPVPCRTLLPNERPVLVEGGIVSIVNTDIFDPAPLETIKAMLKRVIVKLGA